ncbi:MAG: 30S ribosomal protein S9 [Chloroflexaceae bacterium]|nr:30S ribosomal protein S9 [Chloroflexaceae bacterium]
MSEQRYFQGTGRRKESVARVRLFPGQGTMTVNGRATDDYFGYRVALLHSVRRPLELTEMQAAFDVQIKVRGGGLVGQAGAARLGIARALLDMNGELRPMLKRAGLLTRDARAKERKKVGLKRARKRPQYTKR